MSAGTVAQIRQERLPLAVVDTSVLISMFKGESSAGVFTEALERCDQVLMHHTTYVELCSVIVNMAGPNMLQEMDQLLDNFGIEVVNKNIITDHIEHLQHCMINYGARARCKNGGADLTSAVVTKATKPDLGGNAKARKTPYLNFGDSFPYALAKLRNAPLLFQGRDFAVSDVANAMEELGYQYDEDGNPCPPTAEAEGITLQTD